MDQRTEDDIRAELDRPGPAHFTRGEIRGLLAELDRLRAEVLTAKATGYRQAADNAAEQIQLHGSDADGQMLVVFLQRGAELREQFAARSGQQKPEASQ